MTDAKSNDVRRAGRASERESPDLMPLGPESHMWRDFGSYRYHLLLLQAFVLQSAHPVIDAAVTKEKKYLNDPWGRARSSVQLLWPVVYARPEKAIQMGRELRAMHKAIRGVDKDGKRYSAVDPEAYGWVHLTGFDAAVRTHALFGRPRTAEERAEMFAEWRLVGALLGIPDKNMPRTEDEYWREFDRIIDERLVRGEALNDLLDPDFYAQYPVPASMPWLPAPVFRVLMTPIGRFMHFLTVGTLPAPFREKFGIEWTRRDELVLRAFGSLVRAAHPHVPEDMRFIPLARRARQDARRNPDAYRWPKARPQAAVN